MGTGLFFTPNQLSVVDFVTSVYVAIALVLIRGVTESILVPKLEKYLIEIKAGDAKVAARSFDDAFIAACSLVVEAIALAAMFFGNYGCLPWSTEPCLGGWPHQEFNDIQRWHYLSMFGYYLSELISTALIKGGAIKFGTLLNFEMIMHHFVSMTLISCSYMSHNLRFGVMWMALFDISNPILHLAKTFYPIKRADFDALSKKIFAAFALVFFIVRVCAGPYSVLYTVAGLFSMSSVYYALGFNALAWFIYGLQLLWFYKIAKLALGGGGGAKKKEEKAE